MPQPQTKSYDLTIDGQPYTMSFPASYNNAQLSDAVAQATNYVRSTPAHQNAVAQAQKQQAVKEWLSQQIQGRANDFQVPIPTVTNNGQTSINPGVIQQGITNYMQSVGDANTPDIGAAYSKSIAPLNLPLDGDILSLDQEQSAAINPIITNPRAIAQARIVAGLDAPPPSISPPSFPAGSPERQAAYDSVNPTIDSAMRDILANGNEQAPGSIVNNPIYQGIAQQAYAGLQPQNVALMLAAPEIGELTGIPQLLGKLFMGLGAKSLVETALDNDLRKSNPGQYAGRLIAGATLLLGPMAAEKLAPMILESAKPQLPDLNLDFMNDQNLKPLAETGTARQDALQAKSDAIKARAQAQGSFVPPPTEPLSTPIKDNASELPAEYGGDSLLKQAGTINENQSRRTLPIDTPNEPTGPTPVPTNENLANPGAGELFRQLLDKTRNFFVENLSGMKRDAPDSHAATVKYASSGDIANVEASQAVPEVLQHLGDDDAQRFQTYMVADRIANLKDQLSKALRQADKADRPAIREQIDNLALGRKTDPLLDPVTQEPITEQMVQDFFNKPDVQKAVEAHKSTVEPLLTENFEGGGYEANGIRGKYSDAFTPALALDENGEPFQFQGRPSAWTRPNAALGGVPGSQAFEGSASSYLPDYTDAITQRLQSGERAANQRDMVAQWLHDGIAVDPEVNPEKIVQGTMKGSDQEQTMIDFKGQLEPATKVSLAGKFGWSPGANNGLPQEVYMPTRLVNELEPVFDKSQTDHLTFITNALQKTGIDAYLYGTGDAIAHSMALTSRLAKQVPLSTRTDFIGKATNAVANIVPFVKSLSNVRNLLPSRWTDAQRAPAIQFMAENGRLPRNFGKVPDPDANILARSKDALNSALNGPRGVVVNAGTTMYQYVDSLPGGVADPKNAALLRDMMGELNTGLKALRPKLQTAVNNVGLGTFYQTGIRNRLSTFHQAPAAIVGGMVGSILLQPLLWKALDPEHRNPMDVPGYKLGDIPIPGKSAEGKTRIVNLNVLDRTQGYANFIPNTIMASMANKDNALHTGLNMAASTANQVLTPMGSGPLGNLVSAISGVSPAIKPNDTLSGFQLIPSRSANMPLLSTSRFGSALEGLLPQTAAFQDTTNGQDAEVSNLNRVLRFIGVPGIQLLPPGPVILKSEREKENRANALGRLK